MRNELPAASWLLPTHMQRSIGLPGDAGEVGGGIVGVGGGEDDISVGLVGGLELGVVGGGDEVDGWLVVLEQVVADGEGGHGVLSQDQPVVAGQGGGVDGDVLGVAV